MCHHVPSRRDLVSDPPSQLPHPCVKIYPKVSSSGGRFGLNLSLLFYLDATDGTASQIPSVSGHHLPDPQKESSDAFTPLKSITGGLYAILKYYDVRYPCFTKPRHRSLLNQQTMANRDIIESLILRAEGLAQSPSSPAPESEIEEMERRKILRR